MLTANGWKEYELLDCGGEERLERWGKYVLRRPDPQAAFPRASEKGWNGADAVYTRIGGGGAWTKKDVPESWTVGYGDLRFTVKPMNFKHTGLFPEQAVNWDRCRDLIAAAKRPVKVLNLFAYTGGATVACAKAGAAVTHVDAAKGMVQTAKENAALSGLAEAKIRYIVDDCKKFVEREIRRNSRYDAVIMDPPSYGRGPGGEIWKIEEMLYPLVKLCTETLTDDPLFFLVNSYTTGLSPCTVEYILNTLLGKRGGRTCADELGLVSSASGLPLPCGASALWQAK
ncbi:MAG: class I SAM-dependent methyltransferase [Clostridia bacterium]|nr:class I SAM-dependent methyltransferase [Clostridia bacterium]